MIFESRTYRIFDLLDWHEQGYLELSPKFQRREVWSTEAKSYFLDSLIMEKPTHKIFLREYIERAVTKREVVDGQQRLRSILQYCNDEIFILNKHNTTFGGLRFSELPVEIQNSFLNYKLAIDVLYEANDIEVLDLFARLNTYTVKLNNQELRNAKYHGKFKELVYNLGQKSIDFYLNNKIFTAKRIMRMYEVELISELIIAMLDGLQDKKDSIDDFYELYNDEFFESDRIMNEYWDVINILENNYKKAIIDTKFSNKAPFYSLFLVIYDIKYGLPEQEGPYTISKDFSEASPALYKLSEQLRMEEPNSQYVVFKTACYGQTDNIKPRQTRHDTIFSELYKLLR